jgi:Zn-dependent protease
MESTTPWLSTPVPTPPALEPGLPERDPRELGAPFQERKRSPLKRKLSAALAALVAFLSKVKSLLVLAPKFKVLTTGATMAVSIAAYTWLWGLPFAAGFVVLLLVHEMGHVIQLRREGIKASAPMFIPFLGALITAKSLGEDALAEARVGLAGPILGTVGAAACLPIYALTGQPVFLGLAYIGFFLNLFNLIPVLPLDGGRAAAAMSPRIWFAGFAAMLALIFFGGFGDRGSILILVLLFGARETFMRWRQIRSRSLETAAFYRVPRSGRLLVGAVYVGLIAFLVLGMHFAYVNHTI